MSGNGVRIADPLDPRVIVAHLRRARARLEAWIAEPGGDLAPRPRGIWYSELAALVTWLDVFAVRTVIESGIHQGQSTACLYRWAAETPGTTVVSLDHALSEATRVRVQSAHGLLLQASAEHAVPILLANRPSASCALLLDGPKDHAALALADVAFETGAVAFVAVHDMYQGAPARVEAEQRFRTWDTDRPVHQAVMATLDTGHHAAWLDQRGAGKLPYTRVFPDGRHEAMPSYGPTLLFLLGRTATDAR